MQVFFFGGYTSKHEVKRQTSTRFIIKTRPPPHRVWCCLRGRPLDFQMNILFSAPSAVTRFLFALFFLWPSPPPPFYFRINSPRARCTRRRRRRREFSTVPNGRNNYFRILDAYTSLISIIGDNRRPRVVVVGVRRSMRGRDIERTETKRFSMEFFNGRALPETLDL